MITKREYNDILHSVRLYVDSLLSGYSTQSKSIGAFEVERMGSFGGKSGIDHVTFRHLLRTLQGMPDKEGQEESLAPEQIVALSGMFIRSLFADGSAVCEVRVGSEWYERAEDEDDVREVVGRMRVFDVQSGKTSGVLYCQGRYQTVGGEMYLWGEVKHDMSTGYYSGDYATEIDVLRDNSGWIQIYQGDGVKEADVEVIEYTAPERKTYYAFASGNDIVYTDTASPEILYSKVYRMGSSDEMIESGVVSNTKTYGDYQSEYVEANADKYMYLDESGIALYRALQRQEVLEVATDSEIRELFE